MLNSQIITLKNILRDEDLQKYAGDGFWNLIQTVVLSDPFAAVTTMKDIKELIFHIPTVL